MRPELDEYLFNIAFVVATRATCPDLHVGCVITTEKGYVLSTGYNGAISGEKHCSSINRECLENKKDKHRVLHAEMNAVAAAAKNGVSLEGSIAYITHKPCTKCELLLKQSGVKKIKVKNT